MSISIGHCQSKVRPPVTRGAIRLPDVEPIPLFQLLAGGDPARGDDVRRHCQSKFYTGLAGLPPAATTIDFSRESPTRTSDFEPKNGLYLFALTVPQRPLPTETLRRFGGVAGSHGIDPRRVWASCAWRRQFAVGLTAPPRTNTVIDK